MTTALITGSTAGIGAAFARRLAASGTDGSGADRGHGAGHHLVLVARDRERLRRQATELHDRHGVEVEVLPADLSTDEGIGAVEARLADRTHPVDLLVNNAGFGNKGAYLEVPLADELKMLKVHCEAVLRLTTAATASMRERGGAASSTSPRSPPSCRAAPTARPRRGWCSSPRAPPTTWPVPGCG